MDEKLRITEIFFSIQGESRTVGWPTVFIRLTGCPLRCQYCDTSYAFQGGSWWKIDDILSEVARYGAHYVTVTGGEPLAQKACLFLLSKLCDAGQIVSLETSGAIDVGGVDPRVVKVMDVKTPASGEVTRNHFANIAQLLPHDQVKFVICDRADYEWSKAKVLEWNLTSRCEVLFSPSDGQVSLQNLADWILIDRLPVRFQVQLHKIVWGDVQGR
ncbi:MAG: 7-carboxy-7-deazaguanine synthase QueE [Pseudomonadota bacterium]